MQVGHGIGAAVPHRYGVATKGIILFLDPGAVLFPLPQVEGGDAIPGAVNPVGVSVVAILLTETSMQGYLIVVLFRKLANLIFPYGRVSLLLLVHGFLTRHPMQVSQVSTIQLNNSNSIILNKFLL